MVTNSPKAYASSGVYMWSVATWKIGLRIP